MDIPREGIEGKIVIVGLVAEGLTQPVATPFGPADTHEINAKMLETIMAGTSIKRIDVADLIEIVSFFLFGLILLLVVPRVSVKWTVPTFVLLFS